MTIEEIEKALSEAGIEESRTEAYLLAEHFCSLPKSSLVLMRKKDLDSLELKKAVQRRMNREPLAYITGVAYFMNEEYEVTPDCLIPRPETELLTEQAAKALPNGGFFLDLCTGSGCIAISLLAMRKDAFGWAVDISPEACRLAQRNAQKNGVEERLRVLCSDVFEWVPESETFSSTEQKSFPLLEADSVSIKFDIITANPPYITTEEMKSLEPELFFEPVFALTDGGDGLTFIREIITRYVGYVKSGGKIFCEIGSGEGTAALSIAKSHGLKGEILKDLSGRDRILQIDIL